MEATSQLRGGGGGLWNHARAAPYSRDTQEMLRSMMQESRLTNLQRRQINDCLKNGAALPLASDLRSSPPAPQSKPSKQGQKQVLGKPQRRSAESCRSGDNYVREKFCPGPRKDLDKEKRRLQSLMATGQEEPTVPSHTNVPAEVTEEKDRFQEVLDEIEERRQFLADMASLGQEKKYIHIINAEISQKIRELEVLEKTCRRDKEEERGGGADEKTPNRHHHAEKLLF